MPIRLPHMTEIHLPASLVIVLVAAAIPLGWGVARLLHHVLGTPVPTLLLIVADVAAATWAAASLPHTLLLPVSCALGWVLAALAVADLVAYRLPDVLTLPLIAAGLVVSRLLPDPDLAGHAIGAVLGFGIFAAVAVAYRNLRGREGLGLGDAKLAAAAGAWLGWQALPSVVLVAALGGILWVALRYLIQGRASLGERIAFGVPLCAAFWLAWIYGPLLPLT